MVSLNTQSDDAGPRTSQEGAPRLCGLDAYEELQEVNALSHPFEGLGIEK